MRFHALITRANRAAVAVIALCAACDGAVAQPLPATLPLDVWGPSGQVTGVVRDGHLLYVAGDFVYVGPSTGQIARFSDVTGAALPGNVIDEITGQFDDMVPAGGGGWILSGTFGVPGDTRTRRLIRIEPDGALNAGWRPDVDGVVMSIAIDGTTLYIAGALNAVNGQARSGVAALDAVTGAVLPWAPAMQGGQVSSHPIVEHIHAHQGLVFVAGDFVSVDGAPVQDLAAIDAATGQLHPTPASPLANVMALASRGDELFAIGHVVGTPQVSGAVLALAAGTWRSWPVPAVTAVRNLVVSATAAYIQGVEVVVVDTASGQEIGARLLGAEYVNDIALGTNVLYVATAQAVHVLSLVAHTDVRPPILADRLVTALAVNGVELALAGDFDSAGGVRRDGLYALDLTTGRPTAFDPRVYHPDAMVRVGDFLVIGGAGLTNGYGGPGLGMLAAVHLPDGAILPWNPGLNGRVSALAADARLLYAGGEFDSVAGASRPYLAAWELPTGRLSAFRPAPNGRVTAIALDGRDLVVGGWFSSVGGVPRKNVARVRADDGGVTPWAAPPVRPLSSVAAGRGLTATAGRAVVLGEPVPPNTLTVVNATGDAVPLTPPAGIDTAMGVELYGAQLFVAGGVPAGNTGALFRAGLSRTETGVDTGWQSTFVNRRSSGSTWFLQRLPDMLLVGGTFTRVNGRPLRGLAAFPAASALPPANLRSAVVGDLVTLSWAPGDALSPSAYQLDVAVAGTPIGPFTVPGSNVQTRVAPGIYDVRVRALIDGVAGLPSATVRLVVPDPPVPPPAPTQLAASVAGGIVTLSWAAGTGAANVTSFVIEAGSQGGSANLGAFGTGVVDTTFSALVPSGTYYVRLRAANAHGLSAASNEVVVVVP